MENCLRKVRFCQRPHSSAVASCCKLNGQILSSSLRYTRGNPLPDYRSSSSNFEVPLHGRIRSLAAATNAFGTVSKLHSRPPCYATFVKSSIWTCQLSDCPSPLHRQILKPREKSRRITLSPGSVFSGALLSDETSSSLREEHVEQVQKYYDENEFLFLEEVWGTSEDDDAGSARPDWFEEKLTLSLAAGRVNKGSQVLVVGGSPAFVQQLSLTFSPNSLVVVHFSLSVLCAIKEANDDAVCLCGDMEDRPDINGPFDAVFLNSVMAIAHSPAQLLQVVATLCKSGSRIVISHNWGREHMGLFTGKNPQLLIRNPPDLLSLNTLINELPLKVVEFLDEKTFYLAAVEVTAPPGFCTGQNRPRESSNSSKKDEKFPLRARGHIVYGGGRGGKELGIPTANMDPRELPTDILELPKGVYFGWAQVKADGVDDRVHKMVMNIGNRPTFADGEQVTLEVHILQFYGSDFYGKELSIIVLGFIRDEMRFDSSDDLLQRINRDVYVAEKFLEEDWMLQFASDGFFDEELRA